MRFPAAAIAALCAIAAAGCGLGEGESSEGAATLVVTRDYGSERIAAATVDDPSETETVIRLLDRETEITTRYGGGFVQSIEGISGDSAGGRRSDWFFFVNGVESPVGSAERSVRAGDRIWWDYRDWTDAMRAPAVVGSWPEPFAQESTEAADRLPVRIECAGAREPCDAVERRLAAEDVESSVVGAGDRQAGGGEALRLLVGPWSRIDDDPAAALLDGGPATSGVFARFEPGSRAGAASLVGLDERAHAAARLGPGSGLVAAVRDGEDPPAWLVTGTDARGVAAAAELLDRSALANRYALAVDATATIPLPVPEERE
jgi:hypothetical protein